MTVRESYDLWAGQYDTNVNRTRDLEAIALRGLLTPLNFKKCLEIGCGTGKNTVWLADRAEYLTAVDLSENMLQKAKEKISRPNVVFHRADITRNWTFTQTMFDLVTFSLILEHVEDLNAVFLQAGAKLAPGGLLYVGELHPFKQYLGSKARFDTGAGRHILPCFNHHLSDFVQAIKVADCELLTIEEHFDGDGRGGVPRILTMLAQKR